MKLSLVDNLVMPKEGELALLDVHPHLGLLSLAAVAEANGHRVGIYDPKRLIRWGQLPYDSNLYERVALDLIADSPEAVGFTTLGCSFLFAVNVAAVLKRHEPELPILLGGPHATMLHQAILESFCQFDVVVRHEAEETLPAVLANLEQRRFEDIPGISWRASRTLGTRFTPGQPKVEDLDRLPNLSYDHYPIGELDLHLLRIEAGRGCPFQCTFCSTAKFFQRSFRLKSADRLVAELDCLHERYGCSDFKLDHDMFTVNRHKVLEFCEAVKGRGYRWRASARVDCVDESLLGKMAEAGCVELYFGIETGSTRMQRVLKKRLDLELVEPILAAAGDLGIETIASFITGFPEEREEDLDETLDLLGSCFHPTCVPQLHILTPEPGTPLFSEHRDVLKIDGYTNHFNARLVGPRDQRLVDKYPDVFSTYYHYPTDTPRALHTFAVDSVDALRQLGPIVLRYMLRLYGKRLSNVLRNLYDWMALSTEHNVVNSSVIEAYTYSKLGPRHHLTSLVRYALRAYATHPNELHKPEPPRFELNPEQPYQLGDNVWVLEQLHDCGALIDRLAIDPDVVFPVDEVEPVELGVYLLSSRCGLAKTYRIDDGVAAILSLFEQPRTFAKVNKIICSATNALPIDAGFFETLVREGILTIAESGTVKTPCVKTQSFA